MGMVFGKTGASEPVFEVLLSRTMSSPATVKCPYEIRRYGTRCAVEAPYGMGDSPFMILAGYIGVVSSPQNEGNKSMAMTTPVAISSSGGGTKISMTTPVVMESTASSSSSSAKKIMQFMLPEEYDSINKVPKPTDSRVLVKKLPPAVGAVHTFSGSFNDTVSQKKATELARQLKDDGLVVINSSKFQLWAYNGPMTIPFLKRNEIWIEITEKQASDLKEKFHHDEK